MLEFPFRFTDNSDVFLSLKNSAKRNSTRRHLKLNVKDRPSENISKISAVELEENVNYNNNNNDDGIIITVLFVPETSLEIDK